MRRVRLAADYFASPVWDLDAGGMLELSALPIDDGLAARLRAWADRFDATLDAGEPLRSGFATPQDQADFMADGRTLASDLRRQLGTGYVVEYAGDSDDRPDA